MQVFPHHTGRKQDLFNPTKFYYKMYYTFTVNGSMIQHLIDNSKLEVAKNREGVYISNSKVKMGGEKTGMRMQKCLYIINV